MRSGLSLFYIGAKVLANWVKETTTTTGTGTLTLSSASGFVRFSQAFSVGDYVSYSIETSDGKRESGIGKVAASNTLERTLVTATWDGSTYTAAGASTLSLAAGTHTVICAPLAGSTIEPGFGIYDVDSVGTSYTQPLNHASANYTLSLYAERVMMFPILIGQRINIASIGIVVTSAASETTAQLGIYNLNSSGFPERRLCVVTGLDCTSTGFKAGSVSLSVTPGWYAAAVVATTGAPTLRATYFSYTLAGTPFGSWSDPATVQMLMRNVVATTLDDPMPTSSVVSVTYGHPPRIFLGGS